MTTLTSADGSPEVINARRTESLDAPNILKLVQPSTEALFGRVNVVNLIEKAVLAVTLSNDRDEVLGHAAFFDYPNLPDVDPSSWEQWLLKYYDSSNCTALNTLFMHYFVAKPEYSHGAAQEIIRTMFNAVPDLHYCFLTVPTGVFPDSALADLFNQVDKKGESIKGPDNGAIFGCYRYDHVPVLHVRHAKVEDHDDLVPIFNRQSEALNQTYGDYFLAELIEAQDDTMQCIVAEVEGTAIGFMSICTDVNVDLLNECFELGPFHGLHKPHPEDELHPPKTPTPSPKLSSPRSEPERPLSGKSDRSSSSAKSKKSIISNNSSQALEESQSRQSQSKSTSRHGSALNSRPSSAGSYKADNSGSQETKINSKLSETQMLGGSQTSLLSDHSVEQSIKHAAEDRTTMGQSSPRQPLIPSTPKPKSPRARVDKRFVPVYKGPISAVCIQLFCIDEQHEMRSSDFLTKLFELFSDYEFAVITVPHLVPEFPLLQQFVRITPRCPSTLAQELYVFSKAGLLRDFQIRRACSNDLEGVQKLVGSLDLHENLLQDLHQFNKARRDDDGTQIQAFVAECAQQIVGIAIIRSEEDIEYIRSHYNVEDFIYYNHHKRDEHGHLHHYALNPIFKHYSKHFLKEILRQAHKTCLYYPLYPPYVQPEMVSDHSLVAALSDMVPVRARRQITYTETEGINAPSERVLKTEQPYALNHINRKLTLEPKVTVNARIVVVGSSDVALSFLETFTFCPHLRFNNLTMISPHGLPGELAPDELRDQMLSCSGCYDEKEHALLSLRTWVNVVYGHMTAIDRRKKHVEVNGSTIVPYDHLILATGLQYQVPFPTDADISRLTTNSEVPNSPDRRFTGLPPKNVFTINDSYDAAVALYWIENNLLHTDGMAIVYGNTLDAYSCVQTLIDMGISGERIVLVEPPLNYETTCFNNTDVESAVLEALKENRVQVFTGYLLAQWNDGKGGDLVTCASFTSATKPVKLQCAAFFAFYKKGVDALAFKAINDACLVYDGRLVTDANFHTNDTSIRAAGPLTKYQRCYHADQWTHANFNSKEVGLQLASVMLSLFDPTLEPEPELPNDMLKLIPLYRNPKIYQAKLPGDYHYLHVAKPGLSTPLNLLMNQNDYGKALITGSPGSAPDYFRLHINQYNAVETITCLSKKTFSMSNMICLYNVHERYLNNLMNRYQNQLIEDFYSYFSEAWCLAIFHDRFPDFRDEVRELLISRPSADVLALEEKVRVLIEEDLNLGPEQRKNLSSLYSDSGAKRAVETRLLSFLTYNYYHLPMYAKPGMV